MKNRYLVLVPIITLLTMTGIISYYFPKVLPFFILDIILDVILLFLGYMFIKRKIQKAEDEYNAQLILEEDEHFEEMFLNEKQISSYESE